MKTKPLNSCILLFYTQRTLNHSQTTAIQSQREFAMGFSSRTGTRVGSHFPVHCDKPGTCDGPASTESDLKQLYNFFHTNETTQVRSRLRGSSHTPTITYTTYLAGFPSKAVIKFGSTDGTKKCGFIFQEYASLPPSIEPQFLNHRFPTPVIVKAARLTPTGNSH